MTVQWVPMVYCRFKGGEERVVGKEQQLAYTAEHDYDRYKCLSQ